MLFHQMEATSNKNGAVVLRYNVCAALHFDSETVITTSAPSAPICCLQSYKCSRTSENRNKIHISIRTRQQRLPNESTNVSVSSSFSFSCFI